MELFNQRPKLLVSCSTSRQTIRNTENKKNGHRSTYQVGKYLARNKHFLILNRELEWHGRRTWLLVLLITCI